MGQAHIGRHIVADVRAAMNAGGWNAGVALALAIPDIGGSIEFPKNSVGKRYRLWAAKYFVPQVPTADAEFLSADELYRLRRTFLYTGTLEVPRGANRTLPGIALYEDEIVEARRSWSAELNLRPMRHDTPHVAARQFCEWQCLAAERWLDDIQNDEAKQATLRGAWSVQRLFFLPSSRLREDSGSGRPTATVSIGF